MLYNIIKIIHIITACLLIGCPFASAWYLFCLRHQQNLTLLLRANQFTLKLNIWLVSLLGLLQPITGFTMIFEKLHHFNWQWIAGSMAAYALAAIFWLFIIFLHERSGEALRYAIEAKQPAPAIYFRYVKLRILFGGLALAAILLAYFIMTSKM